jgi:hypothetical protein
VSCSASASHHLTPRTLLSSSPRRLPPAVDECYAFALTCPITSTSPRPQHGRSAGAALGETHRRSSGTINARLRVTGHLFQSRFGSAVMDQDYLMAAAGYVALNPVRLPGHRTSKAALSARRYIVRAHYLRDVSAK